MSAVFRGLGKIMVFIFGVIFLAISYFSTRSYLNDRSFSQNELQDWVETEAIVESSEIVDISNDLRTEEDDDGDVEREYRSYAVSYEFVASFEAWGDIVSFEDYDSNDGEMGVDDEIPESAYDILEPGDTVAVVYNPDETGSYKIGSKEHWEDMGKVSFGNIFTPLITGLIGAACFISAIMSVVRRITGKKVVVDNRQVIGEPHESD
jgi:hypothetical protein